MATTIEVEVEDAVATLWLNGPRQRNALSQATWMAIPAAIAEAEAAQGCRAIVLRGRGGQFGAGADIKEFGSLFADEASTLAYFERMETAMRSIEAASRPTIALIEGMCIGACVALALACEIRLAAPTSSFAITPAKLGIAYPYGDVARVVAAVGARRAKALMFSGRPIAADTALTYGLIDTVIDGEFEVGAAAIIKNIAACSPFTIATTRRAISAIEAGLAPADAGYPATLVQAVTGADFAEGLTAFAARRAPNFAD